VVLEWRNIPITLIDSQKSEETAQAYENAWLRQLSLPLAPVTEAARSAGRRTLPARHQKAEPTLVEQTGEGGPAPKGHDKDMYLYSPDQLTKLPVLNKSRKSLTVQPNPCSLGP
jgi:hypothetical protein